MRYNRTNQIISSWNFPNRIYIAKWHDSVASLWWASCRVSPVLTMTDHVNSHRIFESPFNQQNAACSSTDVCPEDGLEYIQHPWNASRNRARHRGTIYLGILFLISTKMTAKWCLNSTIIIITSIVTYIFIWRKNPQFLLAADPKGHSFFVRKAKHDCRRNWARPVQTAASLSETLPTVTLLTVTPLTDVQLTVTPTTVTPVTVIPLAETPLTVTPLTVCWLWCRSP